MTAKRRKRDKAQFDLERAQQGLAALVIKAPTAGVVNIMPNYRSGSMFGGEVEFREGDRAWAGAQVVELPDLSSIHLEARLDESDRGRLKVGQAATRQDRGGPGQGLRRDGRSDLRAGESRFQPGLAAAEELRSRARAEGAGSEDPPGHDRDGAHRHRAGARTC